MSKQINELQKVNVEMLSSLSLLERANDTYEEEIGRLKSKEKSMTVHDSINGIDEFSRTEKDNTMLKLLAKEIVEYTHHSNIVLKVIEPSQSVRFFRGQGESN
nr:unnamed protein product [Callosobruchus analis]